MATAEKKRILVVDDDPVIRVMLSDALSFSGFVTECASDGEDALRKLCENNYDLIISDVVMPAMNGLKLYGKIKEISPGYCRRFIFMTGELEPDMLSFFQENGCRYISKPLRIVELLKTVEGIITGEVAKEFSPDKRHEKRFAWEDDCQVFADGSNRLYIFARSQDISRHGARIRAPELIPASVSVLQINFMKLRSYRTARLCWTRPIDEAGTIAGIHFDDPIDISKFDFSAN